MPVSPHLLFYMRAVGLCPLAPARDMTGASTFSAANVDGRVLGLWRACFCDARDVPDLVMLMGRSCARRKHVAQVGQHQCGALRHVDPRRRACARARSTPVAPRVGFFAPNRCSRYASRPCNARERTRTLLVGFGGWMSSGRGVYVRRGRLRFGAPHCRVCVRSCATRF